MPFIITKGSDIDDRGRRVRINRERKPKKNSIESRYFYHTNYNYSPYNNVPESIDGDIIGDRSIKKDDFAVNKGTLTLSSERHYESFDDLQLPVKGASRDMRDVLDLKVYKIKREGLFDRGNEAVGKKVLLSHEDHSIPKSSFLNRGNHKHRDRIKFEINHNDPVKAVDREEEIDKKKPTLLQQIRRIKYTSELAKRENGTKTHEFLKNALSNNERMKFVKCGYSIKNYAKFPSLKEMLDWIQLEMKCEDAVLIQRMIQFVEEIRHYENTLSNKRKARLQHRGMANISDFKVPASATTASTGLPLLEISQHSYENNNSVSVSQPPTQSSQDSTFPFSPRPPPADHSNSHRHTDNSFNVEGRSDIHFKRQIHGNHKQLTLTQQLDYMKQAGVDNFLRHVAPASISEQHTAKSKKSHAYIFREKDKGGTCSTNSQLGDASTVSSAISMQQPKESITVVPPKESTTQRGNKLVHLHRQHRPQRSPRRQSTSSDENSVGLKNSTNTVRRKKKPVVQYSNIPVSMFPEGGDQEIPDSMGYAVTLTAQVVEKTDELTEKNARAIQSARTKGERLLHHWMDFNSKEQHSRELAQRINITKNFERGVNITQQLELFMCDPTEGDSLNLDNTIPEEIDEEGEGDGEENKNILFNTAKKEIKKMRELWKVEKYEQRMSRIFAHKWFVTMVTKLHEYMKKTNNLVPICCLKITFVFRSIIELDFSITEEIFYEVLELTVLNYNDHRKTIVHQVIRAIRDYIGIEPEKYLQYLMRRGIEPSPELVKQIKGKDSRGRSRSPVLETSMHSVYTTRSADSASVNLQPKTTILIVDGI